MDSLNKEINFARAFYFFAFMFLVIYSFNSLSNILTPIAISFFIWFLIMKTNKSYICFNY